MRNAGKTVAFAAASVLALSLTVVVPASVAQRQGPPGPGAPGAGDPYFPLDGNGGYDVGHYDLRIKYRPATDVLAGRATIRARATKSLSGSTSTSSACACAAIRVNGKPAAWSRPPTSSQSSRGTRSARHRRFTVRVRYGGVPPMLEGAGFIATDDGFDIAGQPHVAASWFPVNDHPTDKASYTFHVKVPDGTQGGRQRRPRRQATPAWLDDVDLARRDPMASYLTTVDVGRFRFDRYRHGGIRYLDAIDPDLFDPLAAPTTGTRFAVSQAADNSYKRLAHTIDVPAGRRHRRLRDHPGHRGRLGLRLRRGAHHRRGRLDDPARRERAHHARRPATRASCGPTSIRSSPTHYMTIDQGAETCDPTGDTGEWWAATGESDGPEQWQVDLTPFAGSTVELSITYVSDDVVQHAGVFVDDIEVSTGEGTTSFETGLEGWTVPGAPAGSPGNENDWIVGTIADVPPSPGEIAAGPSPESRKSSDSWPASFGPYPWRSAGGIVDDVEDLGFALETQTRPIYSKDFFTNPLDGDAVVVHELAHQWYGDSLAVKRWRDIWLNEGFATYAEWLWSGREGLGTAQQIFDFFYNDFIPVDDPWWDIRIGDPGPDQLFEFPVYFRGAMTLHQLRLTVGEPRLLPDLAEVGAVAGRGQREDTAVHPACRTDLR